MVLLAGFCSALQGFTVVLQVFYKGVAEVCKILHKLYRDITEALRGYCKVLCGVCGSCGGCGSIVEICLCSKIMKLLDFWLDITFLYAILSFGA